MINNAMIQKVLKGTASVLLLAFIGFQPAFAAPQLRAPQRLWVYGEMQSDHQTPSLYDNSSLATLDRMNGDLLNKFDFTGGSILTFKPSQTELEVGKYFATYNFNENGRSNLLVNIASSNSTYFENPRVLYMYTSGIVKFDIASPNSYTQKTLMEFNDLNVRPAGLLGGTVRIVKTNSKLFFPVRPLIDNYNNSLLGAMDLQTNEGSLVYDFGNRTIRDLVAIGNDVYVAVSGLGIQVFRNGEGSPAPFASSITDAKTITVDSDGNIYVWNPTSRILFKVSPDESVQELSHDFYDVKQLAITTSVAEVLQP